LFQEYNDENFILGIFKKSVWHTF